MGQLSKKIKAFTILFSNTIEMEIFHFHKILFLLFSIKMCNTIQSVTWRPFDHGQEDKVERRMAEWIRDQEVKVGGGEPPRRLNSSSVSCPCNKLLLSSLGPAATVLPRVMGTYTRSYTSYNNRDSYRQNYGSDYRMYYIPTGWLIGDKRGAPTGYIHNNDHSQMCPYTIPSGWMFYSQQHGGWFQDNTLVLRCITP